jgi:hypothetical protein
MPFPNPDTQFKPGGKWHGNAKGRPSSKPLTDLLRQALEQETKKEGQTVADLVVRGLIKGARNGSIGHIRELLDRIEGKVPQAVRVESEHAVTPDVIRRAAEIRERRKPTDTATNT